MPVSQTRNSIFVHRDSGVWRATLGADAETGISSTSDNPFTALTLTIGKAQEQGWKFDRTEMTHEEARDAGLPEIVTEGHQKPDQGEESASPNLDRALKGEKKHQGEPEPARHEKPSGEKPADHGKAHHGKPGHS